jgi:hypothetical protein
MLSSSGKSRFLTGAMRTRVAMLALIGVVFAGAWTIVWLGWPHNYSAVALVRIAPPSAIDYPGIGSDEPSFRELKQRLVAMVSSPTFHKHLLVRHEVAKLALVKKQADATAWLSTSIEASFIDDSDVMKICIRGQNRELREERVVLDAVAQTIVGHAGIEKMNRASRFLNQTKLAFVQARSELDAKISERDKIAAESGELGATQKQRLAEADADIETSRRIVDEMAQNYFAITVHLNSFPDHKIAEPARIIQHAMNVND